MITRRFNTTGITSRSFVEGEILFDVASTQTTRVTSGNSSAVTVDDEVLERYTSAGTVTEGVVSASVLIGQEVVFTNLTPSIATLDASTKQLTRVASGTSLVNVKTQGRIKQIATPISTTASTSADVFSSFATGSLAKHCYDWFLAAVNGKTASSTTLDFLDGSGARSSTIWGNAVDLSSIITAHSGGWQQGALIAPRFALVATHVGASIGQTYTCRNAAGVAVTRTVTGVTDLGSDRLLVCFDSDFTGITPAKLLPSTYSNKYKPGQYLRQGVPVMKWSRVGGFQVGIGVGNGQTGLSYARPAEFTSWYMEWEGGDSGSPYGTVINGQFVLLGNAWTGPGTNDDGGSFISNGITALEAAMNAHVGGSSSTLSYADLSTFTTF